MITDCRQCWKFGKDVCKYTWMYEEGMEMPKTPKECRDYERRDRI